MNDKEMIEEMAKDLKEEKLYALINKTSYMRSAENLYKQGYRKLPKYSVVLSREELDEIIKQTKETEKNYYKRVVIPQERKETAEKFAKEMLSWLEKDDIDGRNCVIEVAKQFGVEIKDN